MTVSDVSDKAIVNAIRLFTLTRGYSPSFREIGEMVGLKSSNTVSYRLRALKKAGLVTYEPRQFRTVRVVERSRAPAVLQAKHEAHDRFRKTMGWDEP